ncbi:MAG: hypothetical protein GXN94_02185, partial [Aquificae bacterium]|nr:hypothetical protein [Aquificota bacterium]
ALQLTEDGFVAVPFGRQGSNILTGMVFAHGFGMVEIGKTSIKDGEEIKVVVFDTSFMDCDMDCF